MDGGQIVAVRPGGRPSRRRVDPPPPREQRTQRLGRPWFGAGLPFAVDERQQRPREGGVGLLRQFGGQRRERVLPRRVDCGAMLGELRFETGKPLRVRRSRVGEQLAARPQRRLVAVAVLRVAGIERQHQPVEEAPPVPRGLDEQPVHRGGEPQHRQPVAERGRRRRAAVDPHQPPPRMRGLDPGAERDRRQIVARKHLREHREAAARPVAHHLGERRAAQPATRREQRDRLQYIGLARAIVAVERDQPRTGGQIRAGVIAKIGQREADQRHRLSA